MNLETAKQHLESIRNYRVPREPIGTVAVMEWLVAEVERLTDANELLRLAVEECRVCHGGPTTLPDLIRRTDE